MGLGLGLDRDRVVTRGDGYVADLVTAVGVVQHLVRVRVQVRGRGRGRGRGRVRVRSCSPAQRRGRRWSPPKAR